MTIDSAKMGEQPIFSTKAHVFHIDPQTKRSWIPASSQAVNVSFFYDNTRSLYRIISVEGNKAVINSTITPNMTFTKTSQKFGQWSDIRANTVYGLGFSSENELNKFIEKFQELKESTRSCVQQKTHNGGSTIITTNASQSPSNRSATLPRSADSNPNTEELNDPMSIASLQLQTNETVSRNLVAHQRSQSLSGLQVNKSLSEASKYFDKDKLGSMVFQTSNEAQLRYENERLKLALAQSSTNAKKWEVELQTLKNNNTRLTSALQESTSNVEEWKRQLQSLKDENNKMRIRILELEASQGNTEAASELSKEIGNIRTKAETLEVDVKQKDKEIEQLKKRLEEHMHISSTSQKVEDKLKTLLTENENLRTQLNRIHDQNDGSKMSEKARKGVLEQLNVRLTQNIQELKSIHQEFSSLLNAS